MCAKKKSFALEPLPLAEKFIFGDQTTKYWQGEDGIYWNQTITPMKGVDPKTFVQWEGGQFAKDAKRVYKHYKAMRGVDAATFESLNYCWFRDKSHVYCLAGEVKGTDAKTFRALDEGRNVHSDSVTVPHSYGCDANAVYCYFFAGKGTVVKGADPATFESLPEDFGRDAKKVYYKGRGVPGANPKTWEWLGGGYSRDGNKAWYNTFRMKEVDAATLVHVPDVLTNYSYARDKDNFYDGGSIADEAKAKKYM